MHVAEAVEVVDELLAARVRWWIGGGWGVDALVGAVTREHRDLDLAVAMEDLDDVVGVLNNLGFKAEVDWLPVRLEMAGGPGGWVDLHPLVFDGVGDAVQAGFDGGTFVYPAADLVSGEIDGRPVPCISARLQRVFHEGYELRAQDLHDLQLLDGLIGEPGGHFARRAVTVPASKRCS